MERHRLESYLTTRLCLLEAWQRLYSEYEPGDPVLSSEIDVYLERVKTLDQNEMVMRNEKEINDTSDIDEIRRVNIKVIEKIYKLHQNHQFFLKNHKEALILEMKGVRKAKALSSQMLTASDDRIPKLDTKA